ncbi:MAG: flagellar hook-length control protein FliK, partial [Acidimicrobiales bacterium]
VSTVTPARAAPLDVTARLQQSDSQAQTEPVAGEPSGSPAALRSDLLEQVGAAPGASRGEVPPAKTAETEAVVPETSYGHADTLASLGGGGEAVPVRPSPANGTDVAPEEPSSSSPAPPAFALRAFGLHGNEPADVSSHDGGRTEPSLPSRATSGDTTGRLGRLVGTDAFASPSGAASAPAPLLETRFGEFAVNLESTPASSTAPQRSDFVVSNATLTAAISKPVSEGSGIYSVTAMLNPPSLGHVQAVVKVDGANVNVSIVAHTPEGHHAIAGHLDELRQELAARGGDVQLSLSDGRNKGRQREETEPPSASGQDAEDGGGLLLTVAPTNAGKSLHVIL